MLWHAKLDGLRGFYQSDVVVSAGNRQSAIHEAENAVREWHSKLVEEQYFSPFVSADPDEAEFSEMVDQWLRRIRSELKEKLAEVESGALVMVRN